MSVLENMLDELDKMIDKNHLLIQDSDSRRKTMEKISETTGLLRAKNLVINYLNNISGENKKNVLASDWIPCSVRMPENAKEKGAFCPKYQIMTPYGVTEGWYNPDKSGWYALFWFMTSRFLECEIDLKRGDIPKVVFIPDGKEAVISAWCPLPESYKPESEFSKYKEPELNNF